MCVCVCVCVCVHILIVWKCLKMQYIIVQIHR